MRTTRAQIFGVGGNFGNNSPTDRTRESMKTTKTIGALAFKILSCVTMTSHGRTGDDTLPGKLKNGKTPEFLPIRKDCTRNSSS